MPNILRVLNQNDVEKHLQLALGEAYNAGIERAAKLADEMGAPRFAVLLRGDEMITENGRRL